MKSKLRTVFLKQECVTRSVFICLGLVALIGAIVILCDGYREITLVHLRLLPVILLSWISSLFI